MQNRFYLFFLCMIFTCTSRSAQVVVPLLSSEGKTYVGAQITTVDKLQSGSKMASAIKTGETFLESIKDKGVNASYSYFTSSDGSRSKIEAGQSPLNLEMFRTRVESVSYPRAGISWGNYLLIPAKYQLKGRVIDFREDYYCDNGQCLKSIKEYGQVMENVYAVFANNPEKTYVGRLLDDLANPSSSRILTTSDPSNSFKNDKGSSLNAMELGVSIVGLREWQCIQCETLGTDDDTSSALNNTLREAAKRFKALSGLDRSGNALATLKQYSTSVVGEQTITTVIGTPHNPR